MAAISHFDADALSVPGGRPVLLVDAASWQPPAVDLQAVVIGIDAGGHLPPVDPTYFDLLLTARERPPLPWVTDANPMWLKQMVEARPLASRIAAKVLRLAEQLSFVDALEVESLAYSTLLAGSEFASWRAAVPCHAIPHPSEPLLIERSDGRLRLTLNDPDGRNAMTAAMRDSLYEALVNALDDPSCPAVSLVGAGKCFSVGGALSEFGGAQDLAAAHATRVLRSCAGKLQALGVRAVAHLHGACIGSGVEIAAAAHRRIAAPDVWFRLPELHMGLIPGAGGTVTVSRAIGRHRTLWLLLSGHRLRARQALEWGLVHSIAAAVSRS